MIIQRYGENVTGYWNPIQTDITASTEAARYAIHTLSPLRIRKNPNRGDTSVINTTDIDAIPPITPIVCPSTTFVRSIVWSEERPSFSSGQSDVSEIEVRERKAEVTRMIRMIVNRIKSRNPVGPSDFRAISAIECPFSR